MKDPHKLDLNYVFSKYGADKKFSNCYLQHNLSFYLMDKSCRYNGFVSLNNEIGTKAAKLPKDFNIPTTTLTSISKIKDKKISHFLL